MPTRTVENYLKRLFMLEQHVPSDARVAMGELAQDVGVTAGTATSMIKHMAESGLVDYAARDGVRLSQRGRVVALSVLRRHRIIELFLVEKMGFDWTEVHEDAEEMEHVISDKLLDRMDEMLGHPAFDPHGDPIPDAVGKMEGRTLLPLDQAKPGHYTVARVTDHAPDVLKHLEANSLTPGSSIEVLSNDAVAQVVQIRSASDQVIALGHNAAQRIHVTPEAQ